MHKEDVLKGNKRSGEMYGCYRLIQSHLVDGHRGKEIWYMGRLLGTALFLKFIKKKIWLFPGVNF